MLKIFSVSIIYFCLCIALFFVFEKQGGKAVPKKFIYAALVFAAVIRLYFALGDRFFETDMSCFQSWGSYMLSVGPRNMYSGEFFLDYPPGYLYVLALIDAIRQLLGLGYESNIAHMLVKLPAMAADFGCSFFIFKFAKEKLNRNTGLFLAGAFLFCPAVIYTSSVWGQIESVFVLLCMLCLYFAYKNKTVQAAVFYAVALTVKSQALLLGPVLFFYIIKRRSLKEFFKAVGVGLGAVYLIVLPFCQKLFDLKWLFDLYLSAATGYDMFTVNGYNFYYFAKLNWVPVGDNHINLIAIPLIVALCGFIVYFSKDNDGIFSGGGVGIVSIFTFCTMMHERYIFPAIILFIFAYIVRRKGLYLLFALGVSILNYINTVCALCLYYGPFRAPEDIARAVSLACVLLTVCAVIYSVYDVIFDKHPHLAIFKNSKIMLAVITALYALFALNSLGSTKAPQSFYQTTAEDKAFRVYFNGENVTVDKIYVYSGLGDEFSGKEGRKVCGVFNMFYAKDGNFEHMSDIKEQSVFAWKEYDANVQTHEMLFQTDYEGQVIYELAFFDEYGEVIPFTVTPVAQSENPYPAANVCDEQNTAPEYISYYNSMYFDEIYHGRTAYEQLHGQSIYETTHPPLGKILISAGVWLFGMTPFGWRIAGAVCGIAMVPVIYLLTLEISKSKKAALIAASLISLDFMHITQTRIATVDTYVVLFCLLTFLFMARYANAVFGDRRAEWSNLALSGAFMGCAVASKWNGAYPMAGLAVFFFVCLALKCRKLSKTREKLDKTEETCYTDFSAEKGEKDNALSKIVEKFDNTGIDMKKYTVQTLLFCIVAFVLVPLVIYSLSFIPVIKADSFGDYIQQLCGLQKHMYDYHSGLEAEHFFSSMWYTWFFNIKPIWYAINEWYGLVNTISAFGNPLIWILTPVGAAYCLYRGIKDKRMGALLPALGYFASYLPWVLVTRLCFIYHYFPCAVFGICCTAILFTDILKANPRHSKKLWVYIALCGVLFLIFLPVLTGIDAPKAYIEFLELLPSWHFVN